MRSTPLHVLRRRLGLVLSVYATVLQLAVALEGAEWQWPLRMHVVWPATASTLAVAVLRAMPLGYFVAFAMRRRRAAAFAAGIAAALGLLFEVVGGIGGGEAHLAVAPVAAFGGLLGACAFLTVATRLRARAASDAVLLAPDLPLVGGVYLTTPLLWLAADAEASAALHRVPWSLALLGLFGASLLASARASRGAAGGGPLVHAGVVASWLLVGLAPLAAVDPLRTAAVIAGVAAFAAAYPLLLGVGGRERRVEGPALRRAIPFLAMHAVLATLAPLASKIAGTRASSLGWVTVDASAAAGGWSEHMALFALLGYLLAELRGRREEPAAHAWHATVPWIGVLAGLACAARVGAAFDGSTAHLLGVALVGAAASVLAARLGVATYALQRDHARTHALGPDGVQGAGIADSSRVDAGPGARRDGRVARPVIFASHGNDTQHGARCTRDAARAEADGGRDRRAERRDGWLGAGRNPAARSAARRTSRPLDQGERRR